MKFSANLGFLWTDRPLVDAIRAAHAAGFDAVECHWPYDTDADDVLSVLKETRLSMLGLNIVRGDVSAGENGMAAIPGRETEARAAIDQAIDYANKIGAQCIHVMAGFADGADAEKTFITNLNYASERAAPSGKTIVIEPLNRHDAPGYFLKTTDQAAQIISTLNAPNVKLMFDCYHVGRTEGDIIYRLGALKHIIGHIQFASVPTRQEPNQGEVNYSAVLAAIKAMGWTQALGAEYKPAGSTDSGLAWMEQLRSA